MIIEVEKNTYYNLMDRLPMFYDKNMDESKVITRFKKIRYTGNGLKFRKDIKIPKSEFMIFPLTCISEIDLWFDNYNGYNFYILLHLNRAGEEYMIIYDEDIVKEPKSTWKRIVEFFKNVLSLEFHI